MTTGLKCFEMYEDVASYSHCYWWSRFPFSTLFTSKM